MRLRVRYRIVCISATPWRGKDVKACLIPALSREQACNLEPSRITSGPCRRPAAAGEGAESGGSVWFFCFWSLLLQDRQELEPTQDPEAQCQGHVLSELQKRPLPSLDLDSRCVCVLFFTAFVLVGHLSILFFLQGEVPALARVQHLQPDDVLPLFTPLAGWANDHLQLLHVASSRQATWLRSKHACTLSFPSDCQAATGDECLAAAACLFHDGLKRCDVSCKTTARLLYALRLALCLGLLEALPPGRKNSTAPTVRW